jgi:SOS-response transcriptional repressor LexA
MDLPIQNGGEMGYCQQARYRREMLFKFIAGFIDKEKYSPTIEEMRAGVRWSTKSLVAFHLDALEAEGKIEILRGVARGVRLRMKEDGNGSIDVGEARNESRAVQGRMPA